MRKKLGKNSTEITEGRNLRMSNSPLVTYTNLSPNHSGKRKYTIDTITPHCVVGQWTAQTGCDYFSNSSVGASCNYFVGKDGSIGLCVDEANRAWTSGGKDKNGNPIYVNGISGAMNDHRAITIEVASDTTHPYAITDQAYEALVKLCADICIRNNIPKLLWEADKSLVGVVSRQNITVHRWFANKACPGDYIYNRLGQIAKEVNNLINNSKNSTTSTTSEEDDDDVKRYERLSDIPESYNFRNIIDDLMTAGIIGGDGSDPTGNNDVIDLSNDMVRMLIFEYRAGVYDNALDNVGLSRRY